jgi:hypothetical protein
VNDFEDELKRSLNDRVDELVGPRRAAPPFDPSGAATPTRSGRFGRPGGGRLPWVLPLIAAASIVVVTIGAVAATTLLADKKPAPPATVAPTPTPTPVVSSPVSTSKTTPRSTAGSSHTPGHPRTSSRSHAGGHGSPGGTSAHPPVPVVVTLGGASITLPAGWVSRDYAHYLPSGSGPVGGQEWCLTPSSLPVSPEPGACPVALSTIDSSGPALDVDVEGGYSSPAFCGTTSGTTSSTTSGTTSSTAQEQTGDRQFGGRSADWRHWTISCGDGTSVEVEQYVVATGPGFIMFSERADSGVQDAMTSIAAKSTLPGATAALRYMDRGYLRGSTVTADGVQITLDRAIDAVGGIVNDDPQTYEYVIPQALFDAAGVQVGDVVTLDTDGSVVTSFSGAPH